MRTPTRDILSAYAGPMPRPVVPIFALPRNRSPTLSIVRWYVAMTWAFALMTRRLVSMPRSCEPVDLTEQHAEVDHDAVADDGNDGRREDAARQQVQGVFLVVDHDRVAGVVAAVEPHAVVELLAEQVGGPALTLVAPLGADEHDRGHRDPLPERN